MKRILFDNCTPATLRKHLKPYDVTTAGEKGWEELKNGELLKRAEREFDVMISCDSNIKYQQRLPDFTIALIVLRGIKNAEPHLIELMPEVLSRLEHIQPGEIVYLFTEAMIEIEKRRGHEFKR